MRYRPHPSNIYAISYGASPKGEIYPRDLGDDVRAITPNEAQRVSHQRSDHIEEAAWVRFTDISGDRDPVMADMFITDIKNGHYTFDTLEGVLTRRSLTPYMQNWMGNLLFSSAVLLSTDLPRGYYQLTPLVPSQLPGTTHQTSSRPQ